MHNALLTLVSLVSLTRAAWTQERTVETDWPHWRGPRGDGSWQGPLINEQFPAKLSVAWEADIGGGYAGVIVVDNKCLLFDRIKRQSTTQPDSKEEATTKEFERLICFDAATGKKLWTYKYEQAYGDLDYGNGPRAAPTVHKGRIYVLGALGKLSCVELDSGKLLWAKDMQSDFYGRPPMWGYSSSPLIYSSENSASLIVTPGGKNGFGVVSLKPHDGSLNWNSLNDKAGYSWPVVVQKPSGSEMIYWSPTHIRSLSPDTGKPYWNVPYEVTYGVSIATPIVCENIALVCGYWHGSKAVRLNSDPAKAKLLWEENRYLRGLMSQPLYKEGLVYLLDKQYGMTCFELKSGKKLWDDKNTLTPRGRNPQASVVWIGEQNRVLALNSEGELVLAQLTKSGYHEFSRTKVSEPTWAHPAYSGDRVFARSDSKLVCIRLPLRK